jgi:ATP-binding cassette subfamily B protein
MRVMKQAAPVDLAMLEDPEFSNMMERARLQATDRSAILTTGGNLIQSLLAAASLIIGCAAFAPWLPFVVAGCALPAFAGETGFAFQAYELARQLTPIRRQIDYVRALGTSLASAREVKMFGLTKYLRERFEALSEHQMDQTNAMALRRLGWGVALGILASLGYYGSYCWLVYAAFHKQITVGTLMFLAGAVAATSTQLQSIFNLFSGLSEHALVPYRPRGIPCGGTQNPFAQKRRRHTAAHSKQH